MASSTPASQRRKVAAASFIGTCIEWYDFYVFSVGASLVFATVFFPTVDPIAGLAASFATYAVGFFARPLGAAIFGSIGDRLGRRRALVMTLVLMGITTCLTGLLPVYDEIGPWAPILLVTLRIIQGVAVGGEWGGAVLMAVEHAPEESKAFYGGFVQLGNPAGGMLATGVFSFLSLFGEEALLSWAWRVPFLISAVLIVVGLVIRTKVEESPVFENSSTPQMHPLRDAIVHNWRPLLLAIGIVAVPSGGYYITSTYFTSFATEDGGLNMTLVLNILTIGSFVELIATIPTAWLADRLGKIRVLVAGIVGLGVFGAITFLVVASGTGGPSLLIAVFVLLRLAGCSAYAALAGVLAQMFPPKARYTSISLGYQVGAAIFGGLSPLAATLLVGATGSVWAVVGLLAVLCMLAAACASAAPQLRDKLADPAPPAEPRSTRAEFGK
ncbi:MFS transporter [Saxibacter everestensis]|uniref:MFS transporter n=1 Tax=Saxibacter everestensis TaxID=2909229 RepID=A0ABY8QSZ1_9MICO|nr:MFS transporter [Brevibacteriaceae bacterium ZFBP1038]